MIIRYNTKIRAPNECVDIQATNKKMYTIKKVSFIINSVRHYDLTRDRH